MGIEATHNKERPGFYMILPPEMGRFENLRKHNNCLHSIRAYSNNKHGETRIYEQ